MKKKVSDDKLDGLFSSIIRILADGECEYCGKYVGYEKLDCAHFHSRHMKTVRWDFRNVAAICGPCHTYFHRHPNKITDWFRKRLGTEVEEQLDILAHMTIKEYPINREEIESNLKEKLKELEG